MKMIKLEDALKEAEEIYKGVFCSEIEQKMHEEIREAVIDCLNSCNVIDAEPIIHAHWEYDSKKDLDDNWSCYCSYCGCRDTHATAMKNKVPHCWNCGAIMDEEVDDE